VSEQRCPVCDGVLTTYKDIKELCCRPCNTWFTVEMLATARATAAKREAEAVRPWRECLAALINGTPAIVTEAVDAARALLAQVP